jgi:hypothetical protein
MSAVQANYQHLVLFWTRGWCAHTHRNPSSTHHLRGSVYEPVRWNLQTQKEGLSREHRRQHPQGTRKRRLTLQHSREYTGVSRPSPVLCCYGCSSWEWILPKANLDGRYLGTWKMNKECTRSSKKAHANFQRRDFHRCDIAPHSMAGQTPMAFSICQELPFKKQPWHWWLHDCMDFRPLLLSMRHIFPLPSILRIIWFGAVEQHAASSQALAVFTCG